MPRTRFLTTLLCSLLLLSQALIPAQAANEQPAPLATSADGVAMDTRLKTLEADLRCLVCRNQSVADSPSEWADGMRAQIRDKMKEGLSDQQIIDFLIARYGDYVTYKPPVKPITYVLWFGPIIVLLIALGVVFTFVRRRSRETPTEALDAAAEARARALLDGDQQ